MAINTYTTGWLSYFLFCLDVEAKTLLLKALSAILNKATSNGRCKVACFEDKSLNNVLHKESQTVMSVINKEKQGATSLRVTENKKENNRLKRKYPFSTEEDENDECGSSSKKEIVSCVSPSPSVPSSSLRTPTTSMSIPVDEIDRSIRSSPAGGSRISKGYLSSVLSDIQQNGGSNISLTNTSNSSSSSNISSSMLSLSTALSSLSVPPELLMKTSSSSLHQSPSTRHSNSSMTNTMAMTSSSPTCTVSSVRPVIHSSTTVMSSTQSRHNRRQRNPPNGGI